MSRRVTFNDDLTVHWVPAYCDCRHAFIPRSENHSHGATQTGAQELHTASSRTEGASRSVPSGFSRNDTTFECEQRIQVYVDNDKRV